MKEILIIIICYLLGSIPFGVIIAKSIRKIDIRDYGSGNIGASNAFRILGPGLAIFVLLGDVLKGFLAIYLFQLFDISNLMIIVIGGLAVIAGHDWSVFLKFKGGKGIATTYGVVLSFHPAIALLSAFTWLIIIALTKYSSVASMTSLSVMLILMFLFQQPIEYIIFGAIILALAIYRHRENIIRLKEGRENKIFKDKKNQNR